MRETSEQAVTAEDVKRLMEAYQRQHHPEGGVASAMFDTGPGLPPEVLVVRLNRPDPPASS